MNDWWNGYLQFVNEFMNGLLGNKVVLVIGTIIFGLLIAFGIYLTWKFIKFIIRKIKYKFFQKPKIQS